MKAPDEPRDGHQEKPRFTRAQLRKAGAAVGIGSAALIAALMYARGRQKQPEKPRVRERFTD